MGEIRQPKSHIVDRVIELKSEN